MPSPLVVTPLCAFGHVASYRELHDHWGAESAIVPFRYACGRRVLWLRSNVYACAHLSYDELLAARVGGHLDCLSALSALGSIRAAAATSSSGTVHVRIAPNDGRASARRFAAERPVTAHWSVPRYALPTVTQARAALRHGSTPLSRAAVPPAEALRQALRTCLTAEQGAAVIAELLALRTLTADELARVLSSSPRRVRAGLRQVDLPAGVIDALESLR